MSAFLPPPLLPFLYIKSVVCNRYGCYHFLLGVTGIVRATKNEKSRPPNTGFAERDK